jgi:hypothetical protein
VAAGLFAAERNAAKPSAEKPKLQLAVAADSSSFAEQPVDSKSKPPEIRGKSPPLKDSRNPFAPQPARRSGVARARIEDALTSMTQMDFKDAPLGDVIDYLKEAHNIEIQLDKRPLEDVDVTAKTRVTIRAEGISLKSALRWMFRNMQPELAYMIKDEVLLITTPEVTAQEQMTEVYDVADLVVCRDEHDVLWDDYDSLIDFITSAIKPTSWSEDPPGSMVGRTLGTAKVLVVIHNCDVQERIADLLEKIHAIGKKHPDAGIPRRSRPTRCAPGHDGRKVVSSSGGTTSTTATGASAPSATPKPAEKPADVAKPPEQKPPTPNGAGGGGTK